MEEELKPNEENKPINEFEPTSIAQPNKTVQPVDVSQPIDETEKTKPVQKSKKPIKILLIVLFVLALIGLIAGATYWLRDKTANEANAKQSAEISTLEKEIASLKKQIAKSDASVTNITTTNQTTCSSKSPTAATIENIKLSITSGNTAALEGYMATSVNTIMAATEGIGPSTPAVAVSTITSFIKNATSPWDFALSASILSSYGKGSYKQYFPNNAVVGKSANGKVISFLFDCNAKINTVFMAPSENLLQ